MKNILYKHPRLFSLVSVSVIVILLLISDSMLVSPLCSRIISIAIVVLLVIGAFYIGGTFSRLYNLANSDNLTGLDNRAYFSKRLSKEISRSHRKNTDLALLVIDVDNFKSVNDTCGHLAGDETLRSLATIMQKITRNQATIARIGGEEFTLYLPGYRLDQAAQVAERIRQQVERENFEGHMVTISIGVASLQAGDNYYSLFDRADKALYQAKKKRNTVVACTDRLEEITLNQEKVSNTNQLAHLEHDHS